jgi:hypothetical protein
VSSAERQPDDAWQEVRDPVYVVPKPVDPRTAVFTAPHDGEPVRGWCVECGECEVIYFDDEWCFWQPGYVCDAMAFPPTRWAPLS